MNLLGPKFLDLSSEVSLIFCPYFRGFLNLGSSLREVLLYTEAYKVLTYAILTVSSKNEIGFASVIAGELPSPINGRANVESFHCDPNG